MTSIQSIGASSAARACVFGLAFFALAELGHWLSAQAEDLAFATFWPPAGLFLAVLALSSYRAWPALILSASIANLTSKLLLHDMSVPVSLGLCLASDASACLGAWLLRRAVESPFTLSRLRDVLTLVCLSAFASPMLAASIAATTVTLAGGSATYAAAWQTVWIRDAVGVLVVAPVVIGWANRHTAFPDGVRPARVAEAVVLFVGLSVVAEAVYGEWLSAPLAVPVLVLPFLLWAPLRFGPPVASAAILLVSLIGVWNTSQGRGPYAALSAHPSAHVLRSQGTLGVISVSVLVVGAVVAERREAERSRTKLIAQLEQALAEIKTLRGIVPICAWCKKIRDGKGAWQRIEEFIPAHTEAELTHGLCPECLKRELASLGGAAGT